MDNVSTHFKGNSHHLPSHAFRGICQCGRDALSQGGLCFMVISGRGLQSSLNDLISLLVLFKIALI